MIGCAQPVEYNMKFTTEQWLKAVIVSEKNGRIMLLQYLLDSEEIERLAANIDALVEMKCSEQLDLTK